MIARDGNMRQYRLWIWFWDMRTSAKKRSLETQKRLFLRRIRTLGPIGLQMYEHSSICMSIAPSLNDGIVDRAVTSAFRCARTEISKSL